MSDDEVAGVLDGTLPATTRYAVRLRSAARSLTPASAIAPRENFRADLKEQMLREFDRVTTRPSGPIVEVDYGLAHRPMVKRAPARLILDEAAVTMTDLDDINVRDSMLAARVAADIAAHADRKQ